SANASLCARRVASLCPSWNGTSRSPGGNPAAGRYTPQLAGVGLQRRRWYLERRPWRSLEILGGGVRHFSGQCLRGVVSVLNGLRGVTAGTDGGSAALRFPAGWGPWW